MSSKRKICIVTGSRAEYGLLKPLIKDLKAEPEVETLLFVTGSHLSKKFGWTLSDIINDGFKPDAEIPLPVDENTDLSMAYSVAEAVKGFSDAYKKFQPDIVVVLGDRYEIFGAVSAAMLLNIPIAHIHGGERSEGAVDEAIRHAITKMSHLHFAAAEQYRKRIIQMGEAPTRVFDTGGLGVDVIKRTPLFNRDEFEKIFSIKLKKRNLLVTYHPVTLDSESPAGQFKRLLNVLEENLPDTFIIFTKPNADAGSSGIAEAIDDFVRKYPENSAAYYSMGSKGYLSAMSMADAVVGNSSSGLLEAPTFHIGTINIGDRQKGRLKAASVIDCGSDEASIRAAFIKLFSHDFKESLKQSVNPYGEGGASVKIKEVLRGVKLENILRKKFMDIH